MNWRGALLPIALISAVQVLATVQGVESDALASPVQIIAAAWGAIVDGSIPLATVETVLAALGGLAIGGFAGTGIGIALGLSVVFNRLMMVTIELLRPIPSVAIIPLFLLIFGLGFKLEIAIVAFSIMWTMLVLVRAAVSAIEPRLLEVASVLGLSRAQTIWKVVLPSALPRIFVALRLAATVSLIVAITVEVAVNPLGLGYGMMRAQQSLRPELMFAYLFWLILVGWTFNAFLTLLQSFALSRMQPRGKQT